MMKYTRRSKCILLYFNDSNQHLLLQIVNGLILGIKVHLMGIWSFISTRNI